MKIWVDFTQYRRVFVNFRDSQSVEADIADRQTDKQKRAEPVKRIAYLCDIGSESSPPVAWFSTRVREGKNPDGGGEIGVVNDKWKPLHNEPPRALLLKRETLRIGLNRLDCFSRRTLKLQPQAALSALIKSDRIRKLILSLGVDEDPLHFWCRARMSRKTSSAGLH